MGRQRDVGFVSALLLVAGVIAFFFPVQEDFLGYVVLTHPYQEAGGLLIVLGIVALIVTAAVGEDRPNEAHPSMQMSTSTPPVLSPLDTRILTLLDENKDPIEISTATGIAQSIIESKIASLYSEGYITDGRKLTEMGRQELSSSNTRFCTRCGTELRHFAAGTWCPHCQEWRN